MKKHLFKLTLTVFLCAILTLTASAIGVKEDGTLAGLLTGETYIANSVDILEGTVGTESITLDKTTRLDAGVWEVTTPDGIEYIFVPGDETGNISFTPENDNCIAYSADRIVNGLWNYTPDGASTDSRFITTANGIQIDVPKSGLDYIASTGATYGFTNEQIIPAKLFESWSFELDYTSFDGKYADGYSVDDVVGKVVFYLMTPHSTKVSTEEISFEVNADVETYEISAPSSFADSDAYVVGFTVLPWGNTSADVFGTLHRTSNFAYLNFYPDNMVLKLNDSVYSEPDVEPTGIAFAQEEFELPMSSTATLEVVFTPYNTTDKGVTFTSDNADLTVDANGEVTAPGYECTATVTAISKFDPSITATITIIVKAPQAPTGLSGENGHLVGLEAGKSYQAAPLTINANGTGLTKGAYINVDSTTDLAGLYVVRQGNDNTHSADSEIVYVPGDADKRNYLGQLGTNGFVLANYSNITNFYTGIWTSNKGVGTHSTFGTWTLGNTGNGHVSYSQMRNWQDATTTEAKEAAAMVIVDAMNSVYYRYGFEAEEIIPTSDAISQTITVQQNNCYIEFATLRTRIVAYVADETGNITAYSRVYENANFGFNTKYTINIDYTSFLPEEGYLVGLDIYPATDIAYNEFERVVSSGNMRFLVNVDPANYTIMKPAKAPEFSYAPTNQGIKVTITNYDKNATYTVGGTTLPGNAFIVIKPGKYLVSVSGEYLIGTASAYATPTLFTPEVPILSYEPNSPDTFLITIENYSDIYSYEILDYDGWKNLDGDTVEVSVPYTYAVRAGGVAFNGYAEAEIDVEPCVASDPTVKVVAVKDGCMVYITNHSPLYNYEYKPADSSIWTPVKGSSFKVTESGTYVLRAYGWVYSNEATVRFVTKELPDALKNLSVRKVNVDGFEDYWLDGLDPDVVYGYAKVDIRTDFNTLYYYDVIGDTESYLLDGIGLYAIRIASAVDGYDGTPYIIYADSTSEDKVQLGDVIDKGGYQALKTSTSASWTPGTWTGRCSYTHSTFPSPYYISDIGYGISYTLANNLNNAIASGDKAKETEARKAIVQSALESVYKYAYAPEDVIPVNEFIKFTFTTGRRQGYVDLGFVDAKVVFHVMDQTGNISQYSWYGAYDMTSTTSHTISVNYLDENGERVTDIEGLPLDGWVVGIEIYPWTNADPDSITVTSTSSANTMSFITVKDPVTVMETPDCSDLIVFDALPGKQGGVAGFNSRFTYAYRALGDEEWTTVLGNTKLLRLPVGTYEFKIKAIPYVSYESESIVLEIYQSEDALPLDEMTDVGSDDGLVWLYEEKSHTLRILGDRIPDYTQATIPWSKYSAEISTVILDDNIDYIGNYAFYAHKAITSINIPQGVKSIGSNAFYQCGFSDITLPFGLELIGNYAFNNCSSLTNIILPDSVTYLGSNAFYGCSKLENVTLSRGLKTISYMAFSYCNSLERIFIPEGITSVDSYAFINCQKLKDVVLPDSLESIMYNAFIHCRALKSIIIPAGVYSISSNAIGYYNEYVPNGNGYYTAIATKEKDFVIYGYEGTAAESYASNNGFEFKSILAHGILTDDISWIIDYNGVLTLSGEGAVKFEREELAPWYDYSNSITKIVIETGITHIGDNAFHSCLSITDVIFHDKVKEVSDTAFNSEIFDNLTFHCYSNTAPYTYAEGNGIKINRFIRILLSGDCGADVTYSLNEDMVLTVSGTGAMNIFGAPNTAYWSMYRNKIKEVIIADGITSIGDYAFYDHDAIESIVIPDSVLTLGSSCFYDCDSLRTVQFGVKVFGEKVNTIGHSAFAECALLDNVVLPEGIKTLGANCFRNCDSLTSIVIPESVQEFGVYAFYGCDALESVIIEDGLTSIPSYTFSDCTALTSITIPESVNAIGMGAFSRCSSLAEITFTDYLTYMEEGVFVECESLERVTLSNGLTTIPSYTFSDCTSLKEIIIPDSVSFIGAEAFCGCQSLESITLPQGLKNIGSGAFAECYKLEGITLPDNMTHISPYLFYDSGLKSFNVESNIISIGESALGANAQLTDISVAEDNENYASVDGALYSKDGKTLIQVPGGMEQESFYIPDGVTKIGNYAFEGCGNIKTLTVGKGVEEIGVNAFCDNEKLVEILVDEANESFASYDGILFDKGMTVLKRMPTGKQISSYTVPDFVERIDDYAFEGCYTIKDIVLPEGVESIGKYAFRNNASTITLPKSLSEVDTGAFNTVKKLILYGKSFSERYAIAHKITYDIINEAPALFTLTNVTTAPGETFKLTLSLKTKEAINSIAITKLEYNDTLLEFIGFGDYEGISELTALEPVFNNEKGYILLGFKTDDVFDGDICTLEFKVKDDATDFKTSVYATNLVRLDSKDVESDILGGKIEIVSYEKGDIDLDGDVDIDDAVLLFGNTMIPEYYPTEYPGDMDFDGDGDIDLQDAVAVFRYSMLPDVYPLN